MPSCFKICASPRLLLPAHWLPKTDLHCFPWPGQRLLLYHVMYAVCAALEMRRAPHARINSGGCAHVVKKEQDLVEMAPGEMACLSRAQPNKCLPLTKMGSLLFPDVGLVVSRGGGMREVPAADSGRSVVKDGGNVVARRPPVALSGGESIDPRRMSTQTSRAGANSEEGCPGRGVIGAVEPALDVLRADDSRVIASVQPVVAPSEPAIKCVTKVSEGLLARRDIRGVLLELVKDSLLCLSRLHGGSLSNVSAGVLPADVELSWPGVRNLLQRWWPQWDAHVGKGAAIPPPGTVGYLTHPTRPVSSCKWAIDVNMEAMNPVIQRLDLKSARYFDKDNFPPVLTVPRIGANVRGPICVSVATMLLVARKDDHFGAVLTPLAALGWAPVRKMAPLIAATCHDFETAGIGKSDALPPTSGGAQVAEGDKAEGSTLEGDNEFTTTAAVNPSGRQPEVSMEERYNEMDKFLAEEKVADANGHRARRTAARRLCRPQGLLTGRASLPAPPPSGRMTNAAEEIFKKRRLDAGKDTDGAPAAGQPMSSAPKRDSLALLHLCPPRRPAGHGAASSLPAGYGAPVGTFLGASATGSGRSRVPASDNSGDRNVADERVVRANDSLAIGASTSAAAEKLGERLAVSLSPTPPPFLSPEKLEMDRARVATSVAAAQASLASIAARRLQPSSIPGTEPTKQHPQCQTGGRGAEQGDPFSESAADGGPGITN